MDKQLVIDCLELVNLIERTPGSGGMFKPLSVDLRSRLKEELAACELQEQLLRAEPFGPIVPMPEHPTRREIAAMAMQGLCAQIDPSSNLPHSCTARRAVGLADALIAELKRG